MEEIISPAIQRYAEQHTTPETDALQTVHRDTQANVLKARMLSGHLQGSLLSMISHMIQPDFILEIGTYTGYSAICLAAGLKKNGKLITLDVNEELEGRVRNNFKLAGVEEKIDYRIGNALTVIPTLSATFDLVFIDADKESYSRYYDLVFDKVRLGGFMMADNVLWSGKVVEDKNDKDTRAIMDFNDKVHRDPRVENVLLPVRDGILLMRKVSL
jgi:caffeoyl-CoA O-methyltransferase